MKLAEQAAEENKEVGKYRKIAAELKLNFRVFGSILSQERLLPIVNKCTDSKKFAALPRQLTKYFESAIPSLIVISRNLFAKENGFEWTDDILIDELDPETCKEVESIKSTYHEEIKTLKTYEMALLITDCNFALTNLSFIPKNQPVLLYEGKYKTSLTVVKLDGKYSFSFNLKKPHHRIDAENYRGFCGFAQSLPSKIDHKQFKLDIGHKSCPAFKNITSAGDLPIFYAMEDIEPLSIVGFDYGRKYFAIYHIRMEIFSKADGFSLPCKLLTYHILLLNQNLGSSWLECTADSFASLRNEVKDDGFNIIGDYIFQEEEVKTIKKKMDEKLPFFDLRVKIAPTILRVRNAYHSFSEDYRVLFSIYISKFAHRQELREVMNLLVKQLKMVIIPNLDAVEKINDEKFKSTPGNWLQFFALQKIIYTARYNLFSKIRCFLENNLEFSEEKLIRDYKIPKQTAKIDLYPLIFRHAASKHDISILCFLLSAKNARNYINFSGASKKTALHFAVRNKENKCKMETVLLLLDFNADFNLADAETSTPRTLLKDSQEFTFLFRQTEAGTQDPDDIKSEINRELTQYGYKPLLCPGGTAGT